MDVGWIDGNGFGEGVGFAVGCPKILEREKHVHRVSILSCDTYSRSSHWMLSR